MVVHGGQIRACNLQTCQQRGTMKSVGVEGTSMKACGGDELSVQGLRHRHREEERSRVKDRRKIVKKKCKGNEKKRE